MPKEEFFGLKYDVMFKAFFEAKENEDLLKNFLESLLDLQYGSIKEVHIKNSEITAKNFTDKAGRLDLNLKVDNRNVNVEIQINKQAYYKDRAVFYWTSLYNDLTSGESYGQIPDAIAIHILDHRLFDCEEFQSTFMFLETKRHEVLTNKCAIHFFELPKITKKLDNSHRKELWLQLIRANNKNDINTISQLGDDVMMKATHVINNLQDDDQLRELTRMRVKAQNDFFNGISAALEEGEQIGFSKGRAEGEQIGLQRGINGVISKMRNLGYSQSDIDRILNS